jgi:hypothetical protein
MAFNIKPKLVRAIMALFFPGLFWPLPLISISMGLL